MAYKPKNTRQLPIRVAAAEVVAQVLRGQSLSMLLPEYAARVDEKDRALFKEICFGSLRWYPQISILLKQLIQKPLREKDLEVQGLIACGIYQLMYMRISEHAVVNETVSAVNGLNRKWAKGLVNAVLRSFQRQKMDLLAELANNTTFQSAHPKWLMNKLVDAWTQTTADAIVAANNDRGPMTLRVNRRHALRSDYIQRLEKAGISAVKTMHSADGVVLDSPVDVTSLPGFTEGDSSVQDEAAQLAAGLLSLEPGLSILDACSAPGGKTCHILEVEPDLGSVLALDSECRRMPRVEENLARLKLSAELKIADAGDLDSWWDKKAFDRILLDAPCSATGVIRRHPDIKILRKPADIDKLAIIQARLLEILWQTLNNEGILVYATCSILPEENDQVVKAFVASHKDAEIMTIEASWGVATDCGRQLFPTINGSDGFYYARLRKKPSVGKGADKGPE